MTTCVEGQGIQGTTAKNSLYNLGAITASDYRAKYVSDTGGSGIRINGDGLLDNTLVCGEPYCLDAGSWQPATITLEEDFANQIAAQIAKQLDKQKDPIKKNPDVDEVEIPPMSGFVEI